MSELGLHAFLDESRKPLRDGATGGVATWGDHYAIAAVTLLEGTIDDSREQLKAFRRELGFSLHFSDLAPRRRRLVIEGLLTMESWDGFLYESAEPLSRSIPERRMRDRILRVAFDDLATEFGVRAFTLESRATPRHGQWTLNRQDHSTLATLISRGQVPRSAALAHATKSEPILWIADVIASCRTDYLCGKDRSIFPLLAHRLFRISGIQV
jgi:hypothetical protein